MSGQEIAYAPNLTVQLTQYEKRVVVPKSLRLKIGTNEYQDATGQGSLQTLAGAAAGSIDYQAGLATINNYTGGDNNIRTIQSLITVDDASFVWSFDYRSPGSPIKPGGLTLSCTSLDGINITATAQLNGIISNTLIEGTVDYENGLFSGRFGELVADTSLTADEKGEWWYHVDDIDINGDIWKPTYIVPGSLKTSIVYLYNLPLESDKLGINPNRLPPDGRVPIFRAGDLIVIFEEHTMTLPSPLSAGQVIDLTAWSGISKDSIKLVDQLDVVVTIDKYSFNTATNELTMADPLDLIAYTEPLILSFQFEDMNVCSLVSIHGELTVTAPLKNNYSNAAKVASAILLGDLYSASANVFSQKSWYNDWYDYRVGDDSVAKYNAINYPIQVDNEGSVKERFVVKFNSSTNFDIIGETLGVIWSGDIYTDAIPINGQTSLPYFSIPFQGWGTGWINNNVLRFNIISASAPVWALRITNTGAVVNAEERAVIQPRGDS